MSIDFFTIRSEDVTVGNGSSASAGGGAIMVVVAIQLGVCTAPLSDTCLFGFDLSKDVFGLDFGAALAFIA